jgi:hypothetical protein
MTTIPSPFNLELNDGHSKGRWLFQLTGTPEIKWLTQDQFSIVLNSESRRIGDFDEQRSWSGGRGGERFSDDPTKYKDGKEVFTAIEGHVFPSLQWNISTGYRVASQAMPGSVSWRGLFGSTRYISRSFTPGAITSDKAYLWMRKVGTPGTLTFELRSDTAGSPGSVLQTVTKTSADFADVISILQVFNWTGTQALSAATLYHIVVYGASTDQQQSHYEIGVDVTGSASKISSAGSSWAAADFSAYFRITDADIARRWWYFNQGANFCKVSDEATASLYKWNETTDIWEVVSGHGLAQVSGRPIEVNTFVYFPQGESTTVRTWDGTNFASINTGYYFSGLAVGFSASDNSTQIWGFSNTPVAVYRANAVAAYNTDLAWRTGIYIGEKSHTINRIESVNNVLYVYKANSVGKVENDKYEELDYGIRKTPSADNGTASIAWNGMIYFNWLFSTTRIYSGTVDDVGQGFKSNSFPYGREGVDADYCTYVSWMFVAKDAGASGTSSVMLYDGLNWHEFARAWEAGKRIRNVFVQVVSGGRNRLWFDCGGDSCYIELPLNKGNPLYDTGAKYMHEAVLDSAVIDMGTASKLPKYIKEATISAANLDGQGKRIYLDYKVDNDVNWTNAGAFITSPEDTIDINESNIRKFQYRLRIQTDDQLVPPDITGFVPNGFARSPMRKIFSLECKVNNVTVNGKVQKAKDVITWLEEASQSAFPISMKSSYWQLDGYDNVIIAPPSIFPMRANPESDQITFSAMLL